MSGIHVCFKCNSPYNEYTSNKRDGEFTPEEYMKYLCPRCYEEAVDDVMKRLHHKITPKSLIREEF